ncbi:hypothetical protein M409DRAFT_20665 [Zasmidium cellare ATCC 36951]|uniref:TLC domain-containing protein n=1 Tax=Zasmidium cellare ATCC 36951 TaxID=1080233 RepID=A0A6A6CVB5_ZASCE|nr:uncharacterized protein M409DRAFT_20665 [Zasmidium cellare ATCC 36951]KAF2169446.1 hypothetical protein M409DRAFT_20665 [Zasmidium cellare ATCC 36951]
MKDPFPMPPQPWLITLTQPLADALALPTLPLHIHEAIFAFLLYTSIGIFVSPAISRAFFPEKYNKLNRRTRINWDVHVVSLVQSVIISAFSLYVIFVDEERKVLRPRSEWEGRIWEYTGMSGLCQSFALGYFLWDLIMCSVHVDIFGWGMLAHAVSALSVFALGYRPFVYFYAPIFLLYELSSPFLNVHWFCDKLDLTGSAVQAINGAFLVGTFFGCRLVWGNISSFWTFYDIFKAVRYGHSNLTNFETGAPAAFTVQELLSIYSDEQGQRLAFAGRQNVPIWLGLVYLASNLTLNSLNIFWFGKMIETIRKRFDPPWGTKGIGDDVVHYEPQEKVAKAAAALAGSSPAKPKGSVKAARQRAEAAMNGGAGDSTHIQSAVLADGSKSIEVTEQRTLRTRRKA